MDASIEPARRGERGATIARDLRTTVELKSELAPAEALATCKRAGTGVVMSGMSGVFALLGAGCLSAAAIAGLANVVAVWLAALIVGVAYFVMAGTTVVTGRIASSRAATPLPVETIEGATEDVPWIMRHATSAPR
jgi:hypothetical protein